MLVDQQGELLLEFLKTDTIHRRQEKLHHRDIQSRCHNRQDDLVLPVHLALTLCEAEEHCCDKETMELNCEDAEQPHQSAQAGVLAEQETQTAVPLEQALQESLMNLLFRSSCFCPTCSRDRLQRRVLILDGQSRLGNVLESLSHDFILAECCYIPLTRHHV